MNSDKNENWTNSPKDIRILRLLRLIEGVNVSLANCRKMDSNILMRQYEHLKKQYTRELLELLAEYQLPISLSEAA